MPQPSLTTSQAADLVDHFGGVRAASRGAGISYISLWKALNPERAEAHRERYRGSAAGRRVLAEQRRRQRQRRADKGLCTRCGQGPPLSEAVCWTCLNDMEGARLNAVPLRPRT